MTARLDALLDSRVRDIPDWPQPGILFRDITPLLVDPEGLPAVVEAFAGVLADAGFGPGDIDLVAGIEARGFILGAPLAVALGVGFVPVRKQGKLPGDVHSATYDLEYGSATLELQVGSVASGHRVVLIDDVLATGGTAAAAADLLRDAGAHVTAFGCLIELAALAGRDRVHGAPVLSLRVL